MFEVDLSNCQLFDVNKIEFSHKVNFVYGRNGTGKSTLVDIIASQISVGECHVFQGYEKVLGDNDKLNAIVLGEKNVEYDRKIKQKQDEIRSLKLQIKAIKEKIEEPEDGENNLWTAREKAKNRVEKAEKELDRFLTKAASTIKNYNPKISATTYNRKDFLNEIRYATTLNDKDFETAKDVLFARPITAPSIEFFTKPLKTILDATNEILQDKAIERSVIPRIENSKEKRNFAEQGLLLHKPGDVCAFCGNIISKKSYDELNSYFSADEVKKLDEKRKSEISEINGYIEQLSQVKIDKDCFYPEHQEKINELNREYQEKSKVIIGFLEKLVSVLKEKDLIESSPIIELNVPEPLLEISNAYAELRNLNNINDLSERQAIAQKKLRYHLINEELKEFEYQTKKKNEKQLREDLLIAEQNIMIEEEKITGENGLKAKIDLLENEIMELKSKTQDVELLAKHINHKLNNLVSFTLQLVGEEENGYYSVKNKDTGEIRDIKDLSTGEHNIIAFLYVIEKLDEVSAEENKRRVILFDDPMSSNDDVMQYLMIDELNALEKRLKEDDCLIILTHNKHFYLNVKYGWKYSGKDKRRIATFLRLESDNHKTHVSYIDDENKDFKTNYGALWNELIFLYKNKDASADMLLNPIRRIVETYTKFNSITLKDFCEDQEGALKLFNVNSHSIDDLEAELNGMTKDEIIRILERCFAKDNASNHFESYWN